MGEWSNTSFINMKKIIAYTDGSAVASGELKGHGGFGTYFPDLFGEKKAFSKGYLITKTGRMEIIALIYAIKAIPKNTKCILEVYSDSQYVVKSFTEGRLKKWALNNWISYEKEIANVDLWKVVIRELKERPEMVLNMAWIKAHQVDKLKKSQIEEKKELLNDPHIVGNLVADKLADHKRHIKKLKSDKIK
jgi:ribonuclease HI